MVLFARIFKAFWVNRKVFHHLNWIIYRGFLMKLAMLSNLACNSFVSKITFVWEQFDLVFDKRAQNDRTEQTSDIHINTGALNASHIFVFVLNIQCPLSIGVRHIESVCFCRMRTHACSCWWQPQVLLKLLRTKHWQLWIRSSILTFLLNFMNQSEISWILIFIDS